MTNLDTTKTYVLRADAPRIRAASYSPSPESEQVRWQAAQTPLSLYAEHIDGDGEVLVYPVGGTGSRGNDTVYVLATALAEYNPTPTDPRTRLAELEAEIAKVKAEVAAAETAEVEERAQAMRTMFRTRALGNRREHTPWEHVTGDVRNGWLELARTNGEPHAEDPAPPHPRRRGPARRPGLVSERGHGRQRRHRDVPGDDAVRLRTRHVPHRGLDLVADVRPAERARRGQPGPGVVQQQAPLQREDGEHAHGAQGRPRQDAGRLRGRRELLLLITGPVRYTGTRGQLPHLIDQGETMTGITTETKFLINPNAMRAGSYEHEPIEEDLRRAARAGIAVTVSAAYLTRNGSFSPDGDGEVRVLLPDGDGGYVLPRDLTRANSAAVAQARIEAAKAELAAAEAAFEESKAEDVARVEAEATRLHAAFIRVLAEGGAVTIAALADLADEAPVVVEDSEYGTLEDVIVRIDRYHVVTLEQTIGAYTVSRYRDERAGVTLNHLTGLTAFKPYRRVRYEEDVPETSHTYTHEVYVTDGDDLTAKVAAEARSYTSIMGADVTVRVLEVSEERRRVAFDTA
ncbi:hypothetical protein Q3G72_016872 [Acer saccharum]|nr:hypothetical protein Q3G72_016109 [Acer saccharum]KAK1548372.1 hypothetical protein Q3G72_016872 [Acer saccharum]